MTLRSPRKPTSRNIAEATAVEPDRGGNVLLHVRLTLPPNLRHAAGPAFTTTDLRDEDETNGYDAGSQTEVRLHFHADPDSSRDILYSSQAVYLPTQIGNTTPATYDAWNPLCDPDPSASDSLPTGYTDIHWDPSPTLRNGVYDITASITVADVNGQTHTITAPAISLDREDLLITNTSPANPDPVNAAISDPAPFPWAPGMTPIAISASILAAYTASQPVTVTIRDSDQNVIKTIQQSFTIGGSGQATPISVNWDGTQDDDDTTVAPLGIYQYQVEVGDPAGDYDSSRSFHNGAPWLQIASTAVDMTDSDDTSYTFTYTYTLQDSSDTAAKSGQLWLYDPDMQKVQCWDIATLPDQANGGTLTGLQASADGTTHTLTLKVPIASLTFGGDYRFMLHFVDNHADSYKGCNEPSGTVITEEKCALDKNARKYILGPITYINSNGWNVAWALKDRNARRVTILETPAQVHAPLQWVAPLKTALSQPAMGVRVEQQIQAAVNGTFFPYTVYNSNSPTLLRLPANEQCPDPDNPDPWDPHYDPVPKHRKLADIVSGGEVGPSWTPKPLPTRHPRWCFSMATTGPTFMALQMINLDKTGHNPQYVIDPKVKALPFGLSNIGGLTTGGTALTGGTPHNLMEGPKSSFAGYGDTRTAIGWTADGDFFLVAVDLSNKVPNSATADWDAVRNFFANTLPTLAPPGYKIGPIINAFMLDGGGSTQFAYTNNFQDVLGGYSNVQSDDYPVNYGAPKGDDRFLTSIVGLQWP